MKYTVSPIFRQVGFVQSKMMKTTNVCSEPAGNCSLFCSNERFRYFKYHCSSWQVRVPEVVHWTLIGS